MLKHISAATDGAEGEVNAAPGQPVASRCSCELARAYSENLCVGVLDNAPAHVAKSLPEPENVMLMLLPPYRPELNPVEVL